MKLLFLVGQEEDGRYVSIRLDEVVRHDPAPRSIDDLDASEVPTGIIESITPEQEAEEERVRNGQEKMDLGDLSKVLEKNSKKEQDD